MGRGAAGLAAASAGGGGGARVAPAEQDALLGGSLLAEPLDGPSARWLGDRLADLEALPNVRVMTRTTAIGLYDGNMVALVERRGHRRPDPAKGEAREIAVSLRAKTVLFATGALERPLVFANNDRPGIMLASAARTYLNRFAVAPGQRAVVVTNNDSAYRTAGDLAAAGLTVTLVDLRTDADPQLRARAKAQGIELIAGMAVTDAAGRKGVSRVTIGPPGGATAATRECDVVCMSGGWSPVVHLTSHTGIKPRFRDDIAAFVPGGLAAGHFAAGAATGDFGLAAAIRAGASAGREAATLAGHAAAPSELPLPEGETGGYAIAP